MIASQSVCVNLMGGLVMLDIAHERATTTPMQQDACEQLILTLGFLTTKGFQHIWQIKFDHMGKPMVASVM
jgi:hypothetical protein